jgi:hypothetical protein
MWKPKNPNRDTDRIRGEGDFSYKPNRLVLDLKSLQTFKEVSSMKTVFQKLIFSGIGGLVLASSPFFPQAFSQSKTEAPGNIECQMEFNFKSWSFFFNSGKGEGAVSCNNGEKMTVLLKTKGGGVIDFGKSDIINGKGKFSPVANTKEIFGSYSASGGGIGVVKSATGLALSKTKGGVVTLDLSGTGAGTEIGFHFGDFKVEEKRESKY